MQVNLTQRNYLVELSKDGDIKKWDKWAEGGESMEESQE